MLSIRIVFSITLFAVILSCSTSIQQQVFIKNGLEISNSPQNVLFIPFGTISSKYIDNTKMYPEIEFSDSFYCDAANNLVMYECSRFFNIKGVYRNSDTIPRWTIFSNDSSKKGELSSIVSRLAKDSATGHVLIASLCSLKHSVVNQKGWRGGKYDGAYKRPVTYFAQAIIELQLWNKDGVLLYEKRGIGNSGRPILYDVIKKRIRKTDIVNYSRKPFSPPLLRALNQAAHNAMSLR